MSDEKSRRRSEDQEKSGRGSEDQEKGGNACLKIILTLVNLVVLACECALLGALIFFAAKEREILVEQVGQDTYDISFGGVIALSSIVILISLLGALGGIKENSFLLKLYALLMLIFLIGEVGALAYIATEIEVTSKYVETTLYDSIMLYNTSVTVTKAWDTYQAKNKCCGMRRRSEPNVPPHSAYSRAHAAGNLTQLVPDSCCLPDLDESSKKKCAGGSEYFIHKLDCYEVLKNQLDHSLSVIVGIGALKVVITASALILSVMLLMMM